MDSLNDLSHIPLYKKIAEKLLKKMHEKEYLPGERFLSDRDISTSLNVSRSTVNRAVTELVNQGLLVRVHGKGTFIPEKKNKEPEFSFSGSNSLTDALKNSGKNISTRVLHIFEDCSTPFLQKKLNLLDGEKVVGMQRIRYADHIPFAIEYTYLPVKFFPDFFEIDFRNISLYDYMDSKQHKPQFFQQYITVMHPDIEKKRLLKLKSNTQYIFKINFTSADKKKNILEYTESFMDMEDMDMLYEVNFPNLEK